MAHRYSVRENLTIDNVDQTTKELKLFKAAGGSTIVDVTSIGIRRVRTAVYILHCTARVFCNFPSCQLLFSFGTRHRPLYAFFQAYILVSEGLNLEMCN